MYIDSLTILHSLFARKDRYPFNISAINSSGCILFKKKVAFLVGENGSGKSTLLDALARAYGLPVWGGEKSHTAHHNPFANRLQSFVRIAGSWDRGGMVKGFFFRAESFFNFASFVDDMTMTDKDILAYYGGRSLHQQSHGEAFAAFFENRCRLPGLYVLDEPEAALSPPNQLRLLSSLAAALGSDSTQFIISTHSPILLSYPGAQILSCDHAPIKDIPYHETRAYRFYKSFMEDPEAHLKDLMEIRRDEEIHG